MESDRHAEVQFEAQGVVEVERQRDIKGLGLENNQLTSQEQRLVNQVVFERLYKETDGARLASNVRPAVQPMEIEPAVSGSSGFGAVKPSDLPQPFAASYNLFGAGMAAGQSAISAESLTPAERLAEVQTQAIAGAILDTMNANSQPISKALPLRLIVEDGKVSDGFVRLVQAVGDKRLFLYYRPTEVAVADQVKGALTEKGLGWLAANVIPVQEGEVLPQLMAITDDKNLRILFTDADSKDFADSIKDTYDRKLEARFIASPEKVKGVQLTPQEYFVALYLAGEKVLTALGQPSDYNNPAILSILRNNWVKFIALPIKLLEELRKAAAMLRQTEVAA